jgi:hypothetical protein
MEGRFEGQARRKTTVTTLERYIENYGPEVGPKIHHVMRSRAAYKGVSTRRRHQIEALTGRPYRVRRRATPATGQGLLPLAPAEPDQDVVAAGTATGAGSAAMTEGGEAADLLATRPGDPAA